MAIKTAVFASKKRSKEGREFIVYTGRLTKKTDGSEMTVRIKFREDCGAPKPDVCPCIIQFDKTGANLSSKEYIDEATGEYRTAYTLWVNAWSMTDEQYIDHSLDDFD